METVFTLLIGAAITLFFMRGHLRHLRHREARAREAAEQSRGRSDGPRSQHPHIDAARCIGCATCTGVCPEGDVLAMLGGKAAIVNGYKCIGHGLCADACPVGAITMVLASPSVGADMPFLTPEHETTVRNLFIAGELGGLALIKNATNEGRECVDTIAARLGDGQPGTPDPGVLDVLIIGAGPAGISASLRAIERGLNYLTLEQDAVGGTVAKYPRQKLVLTSPVEFPIYGKFKRTELSKEALLSFWNTVLERVDFKVRTGEKVLDVRTGPGGVFTVLTAGSQYQSRAVILALGRGGSPRKLGVPGEELPKVMYRLIEADHYINKRILAVGGGDSAVEAAMGLAQQHGNEVTLSYRQGAFSRIKERNARRLEECVRNGMVNVLLNSTPIAFTPDSVILENQGQTSNIGNDFVWIFAGGEPPHEFLKKIGVGFGMIEMTVESSNAVNEASGSAV